MMSENKIEKQFANLIELLKYSAKIVRKIFTPDAFNYPFLYREYTAHEVLDLYALRKYWATGKLEYATKITQKDIKKRRFKLPDGIYPITRITEKLNLRAYMRSRDKKNLGPKEVVLELILGPEEVNRIQIVYNQGDEIFIKNWEKVFGDDVSILRSDTIFFLISKNGTLEIRTFSLNESENNKTWREEFEEEDDKVKFGTDIVIEGGILSNLIPFGEKPTVIWQYRLSNLFFDLIINFLWNKDEDDKSKILTGIKKLVDKLWTDEMFKVRREFLYINSKIHFEVETNLYNLLNVLEEKKKLLDEMRTNPVKYLPTLSQDTKEIHFYDILEERKANLPPSVYLITQYHPGEIVLKDPMKRTIVIDFIPDYWDNMRKNIIEQELHAELSGIIARWKIGLIYSWPTSNSSDAYLTFFYIDLPFNPYIQYETEWSRVVYIPDEIADFLLDNILKVEPRIQRWIEEKAKKDKEELYKRLEDLLNGLRIGNLSNYTIWAFDDAGEEDKDKRRRIESWKKEWEKLEKESQTSESKKEEKKEKRRKKKEDAIMEVYSGLGKTEYVVQPKQEEISETSESKEEKQQEVLESVQKLKQEIEISKKEEKTFEEPKLQKEKEKQEVEIYTTSMKSTEISKKLDELFIALDNGIKILNKAFGRLHPYSTVLHPVFYSSEFPVGKTNPIDVPYEKVYKGEFKLKDGIYPIIDNVLNGKDFTINNFTILIELTNKTQMIKIRSDETASSLVKGEYYGLDKVLFLVVEKGNMRIEYWRDILEYDEHLGSFITLVILTQEHPERKLIVIYILSKMAVELIEDVLWRNDLLGGLKKFANKLFTDEMARARYIYSYVVEKLDKFDLSKDKRIEKWIDEIQRHPQKYPLPFSSNMPRLSFEDLLYGKHNLVPGLYLITQWHFGDDNSDHLYGNIVLNNSIIIDIPHNRIKSWMEWWKVELSKWGIHFVYVWPNGTIHIFPKLLSANPYLKTENNVMYIPNELSETILKVLNDWPEKEIEQKVQNWAKEKENILNEIIENITRIKMKQSEKTELIKPEQEQEEQEKTTQKPKRKKEEQQEVQIDKEQTEPIKQEKETTEKPKRRKKEEKISETQQKQEDKEVKTESKEITEEIEKETKEIKEQDIMGELESADVNVEAKVKSKVQITLPKEMIEDLEEPKKKAIKRRKKNKRKGTK